MNNFKRGIILLAGLLLSISMTAQQMGENNFKSIKLEAQTDTVQKENIDRFDRWAYSEKKHDVFFYLAPMYQYGTGEPDNAYNLHHDLGLMYRWFMVDNDKIKINFQGWLEQSSLWAGETTSNFSKKTGMISSPNASTVSDHDFSIESFFFEMFLFDQKWDITLGKFDPLFLTTYTNYSGWDKYNYFAKSAASDPVPDLNGGMGLYSEYHVSKSFSFGGLVVDNEAVNDYIYLPDFGSTSWNYMGFLRFKLGNKKGLYSDHNFMVYHQSETKDKTSGSGWIYTANQGLTDKMILILKLSNGSGRIDKLNAAYVAGLSFIDPFQRSADQAGFALMINEKNGQQEYGLDTFYRFFINPYVNIAPNFQAYYTVNDRINTVFGVRAFITF